LPEGKLSDMGPLSGRRPGNWLGRDLADDHHLLPPFLVSPTG